MDSGHFDEEKRDHQEDLEQHPEKLEKVKEILHLLTQTISTMKIFPSEHASVASFVNELISKIKKYLYEYWKFEIDIEENAFTYEGKTVYEDKHPVKSLPLFFFKDGMQKLFFYKGLDKEELREFLEIVKRDFLLPPEESDIVNSLWEKDFPNIRYFAPDDFLESRILAGRDPTEVHVDRNEFVSGTVELTPEDRNEIERASELLKLMAEKREKHEEGTEDDQESPETLAQITSLQEEEMRAIEFMIRSNRRISPEEEFSSLIFEILYLEDRLDQFTATLSVLDQNLQEAIHKGDFAQAYFLLSSVRELMETLSPSSREKKELLRKFLNNTGDENSLVTLKKTFLREPDKDKDSFFQYLKLLGPRTLHLVADLYEDINVPDFRKTALDFLKKMGESHFGSLADLANENRPELTRKIIAFMSTSADKRAVQFLAKFLGYKNKEIKLEAISAIGQMESELGNKILLGFMADEDEEVRTRAASNLKFFGNMGLVEQVKQTALDRSFRKKSFKEKKAILEFLGKTRTEEACRFLETLLNRSSLVFWAAQNEIRLCAVSALALMATPDARGVLEKGREIRNKKIRQACDQALKKLPPIALGEPTGEKEREGHVQA